MIAKRLIVLLAFVLCAATARDARADEDVPGLVRDLPALPPHAIKVPEPPSDFLAENHGFLRVVYHPSVFEGVRQVVRDADASRARFAAMLGQSVLDRVEVRIARTAEEMLLLAPSEAPPDARATAVSYPHVGLIVLSHRALDGSPTDLEAAFRHQLAHVALFDATAGRPLPRWLQEGFAVHGSGDGALRRIHTLVGAHLRSSLLPFQQLDTFPDDPTRARIAHAQSAELVAFLSRGESRARFAATIARVRSGASLDHALVEAYGADLRGLEQRFREDVEHRFVRVPLVVATATGWALAVLVGAAWLRRRRRRLERARATERASIEPPPLEVPEPASSEPRLLVCDRGLGHVLYIVERRGVPKVEHEGKRHTLH